MKMMFSEEAAEKPCHPQKAVKGHILFSSKTERTLEVANVPEDRRLGRGRAAVQHTRTRHQYVTKQPGAWARGEPSRGELEYDSGS